MGKRASRWLLSALLLTGLSSARLPTPLLPQSLHTTPFSAVLRYNVYTFNISATGSGATRELTVRAFRGSLLLTRFQMPTDGAVVGAEVADLDANRFPELYIYTSSDGSGSFGRVLAWQFLPERKADIRPVDWPKMPTGYMGHDSLWTESTILCRKYPVYRPGDANAQPSGGFGMVRYRLQPTGETYALTADSPN